ncbi:MAG TPA: DUF3037 domain-containing protein [Chloroflexota bacterium]|jgi:hypothetical protein|nr:DUF3037 domain-containing protein [Chloroflexota bacterium]
MPAPAAFDYALVRIVPCVERGEFLNVGVILFCRTRRFLGARIELDEARVRALWPAADLDEIRAHLEAIPRVCAGGPGAGPIGRLPLHERFHWLVAPRSTVIQTSPVHSGLCLDPAATLEHLMDRTVRSPGSSAAPA